MVKEIKCWMCNRTKKELQEYIMELYNAGKYVGWPVKWVDDDGDFHNIILDSGGDDNFSVKICPICNSIIDEVALNTAKLYVEDEADGITAEGLKWILKIYDR